ncbi:phytanoyl-CoA dioxygenase family protein [Kaistia geumhonensis]|uniref:Phytanoyl-CoA dioxygenase n=1 Tax=Kaistia geumhonensis TaxID=410839 RepID=A0ABU0M9U4_9HYPH|nr:phytanoyl-CoA dioxygenase family protein [Kaistia geumhonensis]MCX5480721.1 phytanoyl-CoA dioxygenase family protein [Kaistia geumhonensis]MDQ0517575.1 hypothetical protein [Kaistia geumhonensis]
MRDHVENNDVPVRNSANIQRELAENGFVVVRNVLTSDQVSALRQSVRNHLKSAGWYNYGGKFQVQAMHSVPDVGRIITTDRVLDLLEDITSPNKVVLTRECDIMMNTTSTWHKDITQHPIVDGNRVFEDETFRVYKAAFYLQDQDEASRATLKVRPRSHRMKDGTEMPVEPAAVRAGDAVVFDIRIDHVGQFPSLSDKLMRRGFEKIGPRLNVDPQKAFSKARALLRRSHPHGPDRMAIFMTFGPSHEWTRAYASACEQLHAPVDASMNPDVMAHLAARGVSVL